MNAPLPLTNRQVKRFAHRLLAARLALLWENVWPLAWPVPAVLVLFLAVALMDVLPRLGGWIHAGVLGLFIAALTAGAVRLRHVAWPTHEQCARRLERDSALPHRPLALLTDHLAAGADEPQARALWQEEVRRALARLAKLSIRLPMANLPAHDPLGLRFAPWLLLAIGVAAGWHDAPTRLLRAIEPTVLAGSPGTLELWITPPQYTGLPPILMSDRPAGTPVTLPAGSRLAAAVQGGRGRARLFVDGRKIAFESQDATSQRLAMTLTQGHRLVVRQGFRVLARWEVTIVPDNPPGVAFTDPPKPDALARLRFGIEGIDDYGITKLSLELRRADGDGPADSPSLPLPLAGHPRDLRQQFALDLSSHPWSGRRVTLTPVAENGAGLQGRAPPVTITLPQRAFLHPVARALAALRRGLLEDAGARDPAISGLAQLLMSPSAFGGDTIAFLAMTDAQARLIEDRSAAAVDQVIDLLWHTALRVEEGQTADARSAFELAAQALRQALAEGAPASDIEQLMARFRDALGRYVQAVQQAGSHPSQAGAPKRTITGKELQAMLDSLGNLSRTGSAAAAQAMLDQLTTLMEGLEAGGPEGQAGGEGFDPFGRPLAGRDDGVKIPSEGDIGRARAILDELRRRSGDGARPQPEQDYLRRLLDKLY